jgi:hypothetical protein
MNNPIRLIDVDGRAPGNIFGSARLAAADFGHCYNDNSVKVNKEFGTTIYSIMDSDNKIVGYSYSVPTESPAGFAKNLIVINDDPDYYNTENVADAHTHGAYDPKYLVNQFSKADKKSNNEAGTIGFLITSNGSIREYDPKTGSDVNLTNMDPAFSNIPSDQTDPTHVNNVDARSPNLPSNEPSKSTFGTIVTKFLNKLFE